jgi:pilus assembly protein CpaF
LDAVDVVEDEVRELVRRRGLDPTTDGASVRLLVEEVVADYDDRTLSSSLPPLLDRRGAIRAVYDAVAGFGPLQRYLDDPLIEEIWINEPGRVFIAKRGRSELTNTILTSTQVRDLCEKMLKSSGRRVDLSTPFVDAMLPDGSRLHVVIPDITRRHWAINIRKFVLTAHSLDELIALGSITVQAARFLEASVASGLNIIVAGGTQAGKTTLLNCLTAAIPGRERVVTCEEVFELRETVYRCCAHCGPVLRDRPQRYATTVTADTRLAECARASVRRDRRDVEHRTHALGAGDSLRSRLCSAARARCR